MKTVQGKGQLRHHFHGNYFAIIVLAFENASDANGALNVLGAPWSAVNVDRRALVCRAADNELNRILDQLAGFGALRKKIDSIAKSIDYGEPFEVFIPIVEIPKTDLNSVLVNVLKDFQSPKK